MANEQRLIDANALIAILEKIADEDGTKYLHLDEITQEIFDAPTVDAVELVHGQWIFDFSLDDSNFYKCSICGRQEILLAKESISEYCPYCHCGAKMDGGKDNERKAD